MILSMRPIVLAAFLCAALNASAQSGEFNGAWTAWVCPPGVHADSGNCSSFVLSISQKQERLCGTHVFATPGANAMDEGGAPSLLGTVAGDTATIRVESGRGGTQVPAELKLTSKGALQWRRLESPAGDYLLPTTATLFRSKQGKLLSPLFEQRLHAACSTHLIAPNPAAAPAPQPAPSAASQPQTMPPARPPQ